jgi:zinc D-Ala-D-Ala carboxypeptidase
MKWFLAIPPKLRFAIISLSTSLCIIVLGFSLILDLKPSQINVQISPQPSIFPSPQISPTNPISVQESIPSPSLSSPSINRVISPQPSSPPPLRSPKLSVKTYFGHLPYSENTSSQLVSIGRFVRETYEREEFLDAEAAVAFEKMRAAARSEGVQLMPISGFRSISDQQTLFIKQIERRGSAAAAAQVSAPPGYSEHHTGYSVDIADEQKPDTDLKYAFQDTNAYQWLIINAIRYGFEESFPQNNWQGVSYEPWHWRFVTSPRAMEIFATARSLQIER